MRLVSLIFLASTSGFMLAFTSCTTAGKPDWQKIGKIGGRGVDYAAKRYIKDEDAKAFVLDARNIALEPLPMTSAKESVNVNPRP